MKTSDLHESYNFQSSGHLTLRQTQFSGTILTNMTMIHIIIASSLQRHLDGVAVDHTTIPENVKNVVNLIFPFNSHILWNERARSSPPWSTVTPPNHAKKEALKHQESSNSKQT